MKRTELHPDRSLLPDNARILCAVSGGADSLCLLDLLRREGRGISVICAHYNHGLRGAEADRDEAFVRRLCGEWGVPFVCERGDVAALAAQKGLSLETAAREARYAFLARAAAEQGADWIATAHTASDNAETVLLNLSRGTGTRGLAGIPPRRGNIIRPLLSCTREEILAYLAARGIDHVEDSTNALDDAARNRLRHAAIPAMKSVNAAAERNILRACTLLRAEDVYLQEQAAQAAQALWDGESLSVPGLLALPEALRGRVLRLCLGEMELAHQEALLALCRSAAPSGEVCLPGRRVQRSYERLFPAREESARLPERELRAGEKLFLPEADVWVLTEMCQQGTEIQNSFNTFSFACANICGKLFVTARREGDAIALPGRSGRRTLKKWMIEAKIPRRQRDVWPVIRDEEGVLAVPGLGQAERSLPRPGDTVLQVRIIERREDKDQ